MLFVKTNKLKPGMRLARPIYNRDGVLLYERNSKLTPQGIQSIEAFNLIGLFILEPAEPVPPMTQEDILFERFQTMTVFSLREELLKMKEEKKMGPKLHVIANNILRRYGNMDKKINFIQNLRSEEDYVYKHALNTAILCAMISRAVNMKPEEQMDVIYAALLHDIGKLLLPEAIAGKDVPGEEERQATDAYVMSGHELIGEVFISRPGVKRMCTQMHRAWSSFRKGEPDLKRKASLGVKALLAADIYDTMTAMRLDHPPESEVTAIKYLLKHPDIFHPDIVDALMQSINILAPGVSVELSTGETAIVIRNNEWDILRPMVLGFRNNNIMDLDNREYKDIEIRDIMKTMDNRHVMDVQLLRENGYPVPEREGEGPAQPAAVGPEEQVSEKHTYKQ